MKRLGSTQGHSHVPQVRNGNHNWMALPAKYTFTKLSIYIKTAILKKSTFKFQIGHMQKKTMVLQNPNFPNHFNFPNNSESCNKNSVTVEQNL